MRRFVVAAASVAVVGAGWWLPARAENPAPPEAGRASAAMCTWGGTPLAPTGVTTQHPGITNSSAPTDMIFRAVGQLGGDCHGTFTFEGKINAGSSCALVTFQGRAIGIPGVHRFEGYSIGGIAPARLLDDRGNVVGSENAQFLTGSDINDCNTPEGMTGNHFSSVIELLVSPDKQRVRSGSVSTARTPDAGDKPQADAPKTHTWDGTCQLKGALHFDEPLGNQLRPTTFTDQASGTCSGTLDGKPITNLPTSNDVNGFGVLSCAGGHALSSDFLDFGRGRKLHIASDSFAVLIGGVSHFNGWSSGDGIVAVNFDPPDQNTFAQCQAGTLREANYTLSAKSFGPVTG
jgi:hypothetical protein